MDRIKEKLSVVGDAIREKTGKTELLSLDEMPAEIAAIETGIKTDDATAAAGDILSGKTAYVKGNKVTGNIPSKAAATITPKATNQTIAAGTYLSGTQTIAGDADLKADNIKKGINIFGVAGSYEGVELNFNVVTYATEEELLAATPSVNTIGVVTDIPITNWLFGYTEPNPAEEGMVWILTSELSSVEFNALKKNTIQVYPVYAQQYISGSWNTINSKIYQNGWSDLTAKGVPEFSYDGDYEIVNDSDEVILGTNYDNWKIRF